MANPPDVEEAGARRAELDDRPPFLTWRGIYVLVVAVLAVEIVVFTVLTEALR